MELLDGLAPTTYVNDVRGTHYDEVLTQTPPTGVHRWRSPEKDRPPTVVVLGGSEECGKFFGSPKRDVNLFSCFCIRYRTFTRPLSPFGEGERRRGFIEGVEGLNSDTSQCQNPNHYE